jgi:hypothetical protein
MRCAVFVEVSMYFVFVAIGRGLYLHDLAPSALCARNALPRHAVDCFTLVSLCQSGVPSCVCCKQGDGLL